MPSRKKAKGQARKAAKEAAKAKEKESQSVAAINNQQEDETLEAQMKMLQIFNSQSRKFCAHGSPAISDGDFRLCQDFIDAFQTVTASGSEETDGIMDAFIAAHEATKEEFADVYSSKLELVIALLLANGTEHILKERSNRLVYIQAMLACYFEEWAAVNMRKTKALIKWSKIFELYDADEHTLVKYFRKRIPCACLDEKYQEVKSVKMLGYCYNSSCSKPNQMAERSKMFYCTGCGEVNYCSNECQRAHWGEHRGFCHKTMKAKAAFDSKQQA